VEAQLREFLGDAEFDFEWIEGQGGTRSPIETPLWDVIQAFVSELEPGAQVVPLLLSGFTDSHWLREAFGTVSYGFFPMRTMEPEVAALLIHSADERIEVEDLELGVRFLRHAAREVGSLPSTA
jgi:acetylornithine deacetylase/succinyl-diaminopimelate desuccinylase-like protein